MEKDPYVPSNEHWERRLYAGFLICPYCGDVLKIPMESCAQLSEIHSHQFVGGRVDFQRVHVPAVDLAREMIPTKEPNRLDTEVS